MQLITLNEFEINEATSKAINALLQKNFTEVDYHGRDYFKQLPHYRILAKIEEELVGQLAIDYRAMKLNGRPITVFGVIDLCVDPTQQGKGIGTKLLLEFEKLAQQNKAKIDFLFLVTDEPAYYERLGYTAKKLTVTWLKIDQHNNYGLGTEKIDDAAFMVKAIGNKTWDDGELDMLGYMY